MRTHVSEGLAVLELSVEEEEVQDPPVRAFLVLEFPLANLLGPGRKHVRKKVAVGASATCFEKSGVFTALLDTDNFSGSDLSTPQQGV